MSVPYDAAQPYDAPLLYDGEAMAVTLGVDVSSHQGTINWAQVAQSQFQFGLCRMTIGQSTRDTTGRANLAGMLATMPIAGAYGVVGTQEPVEQGATFLLDEIATITDPTRVLVMLDAEDFGNGSHPTIGQVDRYARTLQAGLGRWPVAYVPAWWMGKYGYSAAGRALANCPWAPSHYFDAPWTEARLQANKPPLERGFTRLAWLQYTSSAPCGGIAGRVDANCFYGPLDQLRAQLLGGAPLSATGPASWDDADWQAWDQKRGIRLAQWIAGKTNTVYNVTSVGVPAPASTAALADLRTEFATDVQAILDAVGKGATVTFDPSSLTADQLLALGKGLAGALVIEGMQVKDNQLVVTLTVA